MPMCDKKLSAFKSWSCADRNGLSNAEAQAAQPANHNGAVAALDGSQSIVRAVLAGDLSTIDPNAMGGKEHLASLVTLLLALACVALFVVARLSRAACIAACRQAAGLRRVPVQPVVIRPRTTHGVRKGGASRNLRAVDEGDAIHHAMVDSMMEDDIDDDHPLRSSPRDKSASRTIHLDLDR